MFDGMFGNVFAPIGKDMCKLGMNGKIAIKTPNGYKTFDLKKMKLTNCSNFVMDMDGMFFAVPTFKVENGDIILVSGRPCCVISTDGSTIKTFDYIDGSIKEILPEHHVFMGKTYCYQKIFTPFANMTKDMGAMLKWQMMSKMFGNGNGNGNGNMMNPMMMMFMMNGKNDFFDGMFEGAFNFGEAEANEEENEDEE